MKVINYLNIGLTLSKSGGKYRNINIKITCLCPFHFLRD